jgi:hypothetical protein
MSEVFKDVEEKPVVQDEETTVTVGELFKYTRDDQNPWWKDYSTIIEGCHRFCELDQWNESDGVKLSFYDVPKIAVDRINRGLDTIKGLKSNSRFKKKIVHRELGDKRIAMLLDKVMEQVSYDKNFDIESDGCFDSMLKTGEGLRKVGWDDYLSGGLGDIFDRFVERENVRYSRTRSADLKDVTWICETQMMHWTEAMQLAPERAAEIKGLKATLESEWELLSGGNANSTATGKDYDVEYWGSSGKYAYPDQVKVHEFWMQRLIPVAKVFSFSMNEMGQVMPSMSIAPAGTQGNPGEKVMNTVMEEWWQFVVVGGEKSGILVRGEKSQFGFHPYVGMCAERKKSGMPFGYVERVIPHQIRINMAWAQKQAFNNKSIKSPLVAYGMSAEDVEKATYQSAFGAVLNVTGPGAKIEALNVQPAPNLQAIEEGNAARSDMDFAAAATEDAMRGVAQGGDSGLKVSMMQNAAVTPLNKWTKAYQDSMLTFYRKVLQIIAVKYTPERIQRIVGDQLFMQMVNPVVDENTGQMIQPGIQFPLQIDAVFYDVVIQDQSISDFQKQQAFNAALALHQAGFIMDGEYMIMNAPITNPEEAYASHQKAKADMLVMLMNEIESLQGQLKESQKAAPKDPKAQGGKGKAQAQAGRQKMIGGTAGTSPFTSM